MRLGGDPDRYFFEREQRARDRGILVLVGLEKRLFQKRSIHSICVAASFALVAACGGGGGGGSSSPPSAGSPPPPPPPPPPPIGFDLDGTASKGLILGGSVRVVDANDQTFEIATGSTSTGDGSYVLMVDPAADFTGGMIKVIVSGGNGATMVCDAPSGCGSTAFGDSFALSDMFEISAFVNAPSDGGMVTVHVSALTTLATRLAEQNAGSANINQANVDAANQTVAGLVGLTRSDISSIASVNVADAGAGAEPDTDELAAAFFNAGILESLVEGSGTLDEQFETFIDDFASSGGSIVINESSDDPDLISLEDIVGNVLAVIDTTPRSGPNQTALRESLQASFYAVEVAPADQVGDTLPPPPPIGIAFDIAGTTSKGPIFGGNVRVVAANDPSFEIATGSTSSVDGGYALSVHPLVDFDGGFVKVIVSGGNGATMVCDAPSGCGSSAFGETFSLGDTFEISALAEATVDRGSITVHVNALTTLATRLAEQNATGSTIDQSVIDAANQKLSDLTGLSTIDLVSITGVNIADAGTGLEASPDELRSAFVNAAILESAMEGTAGLETQFEALIADFVASGGFLVINEATDEPGLISLEDIFGNALAATAASPRMGSNRDALRQSFQLGVYAIEAATEDLRDDVLPQRDVLRTGDTQLSISGLRGGLSSEDQIVLNGVGVPWEVTSSDPWIIVDTLSGTGPTTLKVTGSSSALPPGAVAGSITINDTETSNSIVVNINYEVRDNLSTDVSSLVVIEAVNGATTPIVQDFAILGEGLSFDSSTDQSWLSVSPTSGVTTAPTTPATLTVDPSGLSPGSYIGNIDIDDTAFSQSAFIQVRLNIVPRRMYVEEPAVGFHDFPSSSILTRDVSISENLGEPVDWSTSTPVSWLTVTPSGQTGDVISIQADPTGLTAGQLHTAQIQVLSSDPTISNGESIDVGLWIDSTDPAPLIDLNVDVDQIVAHPAYPYVYAYKDGDTDIQVYNVFNGQLVDTISSVTNANGPMAIDEWGFRLLVHDRIANDIAVLSLGSQNIFARWPSEPHDFLLSRRLAGHEIVFTGTGKAYWGLTGGEVALESGDFVPSPGNKNTITLDKSASTLCAVNEETVPYNLICGDISFSESPTPQLRSTRLAPAQQTSDGNGRDVALSDDGNTVHVAPDTAAEFQLFDTIPVETSPGVFEILNSSNLAASSSPVIAEIGPNGIFYGGVSNQGASDDVWAYDPSGNFIRSYAMSGAGDALLPRQFTVSADGSRIIGATENGRLVILSAD